MEQFSRPLNSTRHTLHDFTRVAFIAFTRHPTPKGIRIAQTSEVLPIQKSKLNLHDVLSGSHVATSKNTKTTLPDPLLRDSPVASSHSKDLKFLASQLHEQARFTHSSNLFRPHQKNIECKGINYTSTSRPTSAVMPQPNTLYRLRAEPFLSMWSLDSIPPEGDMFTCVRCEAVKVPPERKTITRSSTSTL